MYLIIVLRCDYMLLVPTVSLSLAFNRVYVFCVQLISTVVNRSWTDIARYGSLENWRELLAALVTYAGPEDFATLCGE